MKRHLVPAAIIAAVVMFVTFATLAVRQTYETYETAHQLFCCQARPVDVLGNAQELHAADDNLSGCLAKHGKPLMVPTQRADGSIVVFYVACSV